MKNKKSIFKKWWFWLILIVVSFILPATFPIPFSSIYTDSQSYTYGNIYSHHGTIQSFCWKNNIIDESALIIQTGDGIRDNFVSIRHEFRLYNLFFPLYCYSRATTTDGERCGSSPVGNCGIGQCFSSVTGSCKNLRSLT